MKRLFAALGLALAALLLFALGKALLFGPAPSVRRQGAHERVDAQALATHLSRAIQFPTLSPAPDGALDGAAFTGLRDELARSYPLVHARFRRELVAGHGLLFALPGSDAAALPVLFLAHQDVVPVADDTRAKWKQPPFSGAIEGGYVWGRGALDDKGPLICLLEALESLLREGFAPKQGVWLAFGFDEESGGELGARAIARELERRKLHFAWAIDEGSGVTLGLVPNVARPVALIAVAEKGYLSLDVTAHAEAGHSSMPGADTAIDRLAHALVKIREHAQSPRMIPLVQQTFATLAPELPLLQRMLLANLTLTGPLVARVFAAKRTTNPLVRTTMAPTILRAGATENVLPGSASAVLNSRLLPGDTPEQLIADLQRTIDDPAVTVVARARTRAAPSLVSSWEGAGYRAIAASVREAYPDAVIAPSLMTAGTDARHYQNVAQDVYRFVPAIITQEDLSAFHGVNERAKLANLVQTVRAYRALLRKL